MGGFRAEDLIRNKLSYRQMGNRAPIWHVTKVLPDGRLWAWRAGCGYRLIERPEHYEVVLEDRIKLGNDHME